MKIAGLMRVGPLAALLSAALLWIGPASAQTQAASGVSNNDSGGMAMPGIMLGGEKQVDPATRERRQEIEKAYKDAIHNNGPQQAAVNDPWANMRGADEQKPAAKSTAKTGKTAQKKKPAQ